jgi:hypothetical protein
MVFSGFNGDSTPETFLEYISSTSNVLGCIKWKAATHLRISKRVLRLSKNSTLIGCFSKGVGNTFGKFVTWLLAAFFSGPVVFQHQTKLASEGT